MLDLDPDRRAPVTDADLRRRVEALEHGVAAHDRSIRHLIATVIEWIEAAQARRRD